jgi:hypothetical protein
MNHSRTLTVAAVVALVGMLAFPMAATAAADLSVGVEQDPDTGEATVTVADNETAVENATVTVTSESGYAGNGTYETDANGSVALPEPNETVSVTVNASSDNVTASQQVELVPREDSLAVSANQSEDGSTTVTVTQYDEPVENASVEVDADSGIAGNDTTDANGTVTLDQPEDDVNATIVATKGNLTAETDVALSGAELAVTAEQRDDGVFVTVTDGDEAVENATVEVESGGDYSGTGTYTTDADGEVALALPTENVTIDVTATDSNETTRTSADLTVDIDSEEPFGLTVSNFVSALQNATVDGPPGQVISEFVTGNNPGSAGDVPGQSGEAPGQSDEAAGESGDAPGQSGDAPGQSGDAPGQSGDDADDENETADDDTEVSESDEQGAAGEEDDDADSDDEGDDDSEDDDSEDDAPGNSGNAPGQN